MEIYAYTKNLYMNVQSSIINDSQEVEKTVVPSTIEWINKLQYIHNGLLTGNKKKKKIYWCMPITLTNLKYIILSERNQTQMATYCMIPFIWQSGKGKIIETENRWVVASGRRLTTKGHFFFFRWWKCFIPWLRWWLHDYVFVRIK